MKIERTLLLTAILLFVLPITGSANTSYYGSVGVSCVTYIDGIADEDIAYAYDMWVAGFVTGTNLEKKRALTTTSELHNAWLKQYCENNPLDMFLTAVMKLNKELDNRTLK